MTGSAQGKTHFHFWMVLLERKAPQIPNFVEQWLLHKPPPASPALSILDTGTAGSSPPQAQVLGMGTMSNCPNMIISPSGASLWAFSHSGHHEHLPRTSVHHGYLPVVSTTSTSLLQAPCACPQCGHLPSWAPPHRGHLLITSTTISPHCKHFPLWTPQTPPCTGTSPSWISPHLVSLPTVGTTSTSLLQALWA